MSYSLLHSKTSVKVVRHNQRIKAVEKIGPRLWNPSSNEEWAPAPADRHFSGGCAAMLPRCLIAMFTAHFDDSGTDKNSDIAIAACYISTKRGWDDFVDAWDNARREEGFDSFHMSDFMAPTAQGKKPWCDWDRDKKTHVYNRLARIINENKRIGIAVAVPKTVWDSTPDYIRGHYGRQHYTFAVRMCMNRIVRWRAESLIKHPVRYVFDWEMHRTPKQEEISKVLDIVARPQNWEVTDLLGLEPEGYAFEHKEKFKPLQAADILAWQMRSHMRKIWPIGRDDVSLCHPGFRLLREDQVVDLGFFTEDQINKFVSENGEMIKAGHGLPQLYS